MKMNLAGKLEGGGDGADLRLRMGDRYSAGASLSNPLDGVTTLLSMAWRHEP